MLFGSCEFFPRFLPLGGAAQNNFALPMHCLSKLGVTIILLPNITQEKVYVIPNLQHYIDC